MENLLAADYGVVIVVFVDAVVAVVAVVVVIERQNSEASVKVWQKGSASEKIEDSKSGEIWSLNPEPHQNFFNFFPFLSSQ